MLYYIDIETNHSADSTAKMAMATSYFFLLSFAVLSALSAAVVSQQERKTLLRIKKAWGDPPTLSSWDDSSALPHCNWTGIQCGVTAGNITTVQGISLYSQGLSLPVPADLICTLGSLSHLDLYDNNLPGPFPTSLYNCTRLAYLDLSQNYFIGQLPPDIHRMSPALTYLILSANNFTGDIPPSIARLPSIEWLFLDNNLFDGTFPPQIGNTSSTLQQLALANNPFRQSRIPPEFGDLAELTFLWMTESNLVGPIPDSFRNLTNLQHLNLAENSLSGPIPAGIWSLENLRYVYLFKNSLVGEIKGPIAASGLIKIDVSINGLSGTIPEDFGKLRNLTVLFMYFNRFSGEIPASIGLLPALTDLRLFNNSLTGILPPELGRHSALWNLEVDDNSLSGELPADLCANGVLVSLVVFNNNLTGSIPTSLGKCDTLANIQIQRNSFSGEFPDGMWSARNLSTVIARDNHLSGILPDELPWNLTRLEVQNNRLSGSVPWSAGNLIVFLAGNNLFSGPVPNFTGMPKLQSLSLGGNLIVGEIPHELVHLISLTDLNLSYNRLTGSIPPLIGLLPVLTSLDLSNNQLTGEVSPAFGNLKLNFLNLSSNNLSGQVPVPLQNEAYARSFYNNSGLCAPSSVLNLPNCGNDTGKSGQLSPGIRTMLIVLGALFVAVAAVFAFFVVRDYKERKSRRGTASSSSWKVTSFRSLAFDESSILRRLTENNLIGSGGSGNVYRVSVGGGSGELVAVKKIRNSRKVDATLEREFESEVQILGSIRHANIVQLLCCVSSAESKLLVYEYMANGSLDRWLHEKRGRGGPPMIRTASGQSVLLDWPRRMGIAIGAAHGLCYMHHDCSPPIVHRDVKSSNILLDKEFRARIADFGLARILVKAGVACSVSAVAGSFGYMAPECGYTSKVNEKMDVYSFGVVLLELTTGREAHDGGEHGGGLADWAWRHFQEGKKAMDAIDDAIKTDTSCLDEIANVMKLGLVCTGTLPSTRPTMKEVVQILLRYERTVGNEDKARRECDEAPLLQMNKDSRSHSPPEGDAVRYNGSASNV